MYHPPVSDRPWLVQNMKKLALYFILSSLIIPVVFLASVSLAKAQNSLPFETVQIRDVQLTSGPDEAEAMPELIGKGAVDPDQPSFNDGEVATLMTTAGPGWSEDLTGSDNPKTLTMTNNKTVVMTVAVDSTLVSDYFD